MLYHELIEGKMEHRSTGNKSYINNEIYIVTMSMSDLSPPSVKKIEGNYQ